MAPRSEARPAYNAPVLHGGYRVTRSRVLFGVLCLVPVLIVTGCSIASRSIRSTFADYNQTVHFNEGQEMLLNLVRIKYRETPLFLKVGALSSSYSFEASAGASFGKSTAAKAYGLDIGSSVSSRPTITYTPIEGNTFVKQILAEIDRETFVLLVRSGWRIGTLCHVLIERIGDALNDDDAPSYGRFTSIVDTVQEAQDANRIEFTLDGDVLGMAVRTPRTALGSDEQAAEMQRHVVDFKMVQFRSLLDVLYYLSKNTEIPAAHRTWVKESAPNGWMRIRVTEGEPENALVWVRHEGYYYSIAHDDIKSKDTFALVQLLFQMQSGDIKSVQPILTLPLAAP